MEKFFVKWICENSVEMEEKFDYLSDARNKKAEWEAQALREEWYGKAVIERVEYEWDWSAGSNPEKYEWSWMECGGEIVGQQRGGRATALFFFENWLEFTLDKVRVTCYNMIVIKIQNKE